MNSWKPEDLPPETIQKVLIVGIAAEELNRRLSEDSLASALKNSGVDATVSYKHVNKERAADKNSFKEAAKQLGINHILLTHLVGTETKQRYNPPMTYAVPSPHTYGKY